LFQRDGFTALRHKFSLVVGVGTAVEHLASGFDDLKDLQAEALVEAIVLGVDQLIQVGGEKECEDCGNYGTHHTGTKNCKNPQI
jgi:hypothetical protein